MMGFAKGSTHPAGFNACISEAFVSSTKSIPPMVMCSPRNGVKAISFGCQRCVSPLCDDLPEFRRKLVAVTSQPLIKRALRPVGRLLGRFLVLRGFALVPL
jgi:hypothetical protein